MGGICVGAWWDMGGAVGPSEVPAGNRWEMDGDTYAEKSYPAEKRSVTPRCDGKDIESHAPLFDVGITSPATISGFSEVPD